MSGLVSLVGAGPGDPDLLTVKAARRIADADVIFHDALISPAVLALARRGWKVPVGKRAGDRTVSQDDIHRRLIRTARAGRRVVRLKCGDPFVLGRGGEEALALAGAGVSFEVVPGISSAIAAPALAHIPVTHRGLSSGFVVVSGHAEATWRPILDALPPSSVTVVVLMGLSSRAKIAAALLARGWPATTPAATLFAASTPQARQWLGSLGELAREPEAPAGSDLAGTVCIGAVVGIAAELARLEASPVPWRKRAARAEP